MRVQVDFSSNFYLFHLDKHLGIFEAKDRESTNLIKYLFSNFSISRGIKYIFERQFYLSSPLWSWYLVLESIQIWAHVQSTYMIPTALSCGTSVTIETTRLCSHEMTNAITLKYESEWARTNTTFTEIKLQFDIRSNGNMPWAHRHYMNIKKKRTL